MQSDGSTTPGVHPISIIPTARKSRGFATLEDAAVNVASVEGIAAIRVYQKSTEESMVKAMAYNGGHATCRCSVPTPFGVVGGGGVRSDRTRETLSLGETFLR
jgi:hypothetical protein